MPRSSLHLRATVTAVGAAGALVAALAFPAAAGASAQHGRAALNLHTTHAHRVVAPATTHPGVVHLRDTGRGQIMVVAARHAGVTLAEVAHGLNASGPKSLLKRFRLVALMTPHTASYVHLARGNYFLADADVTTIHASKISTMLVSGTRRDAVLPTSYVTVFTAHRHLFIPRDLPRNGYLHLENHSSTLVGLLQFPVRAKTTDATLRRFVAHPSFEKLFAVARPDLDDFGFSDIVGPHSSLWPSFHKAAGRYVVVVFALGGSRPGLHRGGVRVIHVG